MRRSDSCNLCHSVSLPSPFQSVHPLSCPGNKISLILTRLHKKIPLEIANIVLLRKISINSIRVFIFPFNPLFKQVVSLGSGSVFHERLVNKK